MRMFLKSLMPAVMAGLFMTASPSQAQQVETDTLSISIGPDLPFLVHIVAKEKGWFEEAGFKTVEFKTFTSGNLAGEALLADEIQLWTPGNLPPVSMAHNGMPVVILGTNAVSHGLEKIVVRQDAGVETPEDLTKVKLGLLVSSTSGALLANVAKHYGLDATKIQTVNLAPPEAMAAMANNEIQGIVFWEPFPYRAVHEQGARIVHSGTKSFFANNSGEDVDVSNNRTVWVASQDWVRANPYATAALVKVLTKAQAYVADPANKDEVLKIFSDFQKQPVDMNAALLSDYTFTPNVDKSYVEDMLAIAGYLKATNRIQGDPKDVLSYTFSGPLKAANAAAVEVEGQWAP
ncbi:ABC transporter substrate-binding protein [Sinorhizobium sp. RAC02]|mgnify:CR=1 FL=1|uniref:ABC transporter substrate-binding protein n=1 Tax=Sinorhizobium sp. RAC02 TaxID=1842534 RepID=UPI00083CF5EF|nr:ABC transporter substrate-binding protein [Sinorhizobium sp. RAC02]AOF93969.1 NMT1-like family protein [Sinorhizobium sp. RAC02]